MMEWTNGNVIIMLKDMMAHRITQELENDAEKCSGTDTEEASECEMTASTVNQPHNVNERLEIKEQMYQDKLANLLSQLELCKQHKHPEYLKVVERLQSELKHRLLLNEVEREYRMMCAERDCLLEKTAAEKEYEEKKAELIEHMMADLEDQRKMIEQEFATMELNGDSVNVKPTVTRKLRRRPNEPMPVPEKRRKPVTNQITFQLDDKEVEQDLKLIARNKPASAGNRSAAQHTINEGASGSGGAASQGRGGGPTNTGTNPADQNGAQAESGGSGTTSTVQSNPSSQQLSEDTRIEDGKLWHERRWFHRGQPVHVEGRGIARFSGNISAIGVEGICVTKTTDGQKVRIFLSHLRRGKVAIKRRAN